jgi:hypothetical protein
MDMGSFTYGWFVSSILFALVVSWLVMKQQDLQKTIRIQQDALDKMYAHAKEIDNSINSLKNDKPDFVKVLKEATQ